MNKLQHIYIAISSLFFISEAQYGSQGIPLSFSRDKYTATVADHVTTGYRILDLEVTGFGENEVQFLIAASDPPDGQMYFKLEQSGHTGWVTVAKDLSPAVHGIYTLFIEARDQINGASTAVTSCEIEVTSRMLQCRTSVKETVDSNLQQVAAFDIPCFPRDGATVVYSLRLPPQNLFASMDETAGRVHVNPPIPCGVASDYMSILASTPGEEESWDINYSFQIRHVPPSATLELAQVNTHSALLSADIASTHLSTQRWRCAKTDDIMHFLLTVTREGGRVVVVRKFPATAGTLEHMVDGLEAGTSYVASFTVVGRESNSTSLPVVFSTLEYYHDKTPIVVSNASNKVEVGETFHLTCHFPEQQVVTFNWFHNGTMVQGQGQSSMELLMTSPSFEDSGVYRCQVSDESLWSRSSGDYFLYVKRKENIHKNEARVKIGVSSRFNKLLSQLSNESSPLFLFAKFYMEDLIDHLMFDRPSYYKSEVIIFDMGDAVVYIKERVNWYEKSSDFVRFLQSRLNGGFEIPDTWMSDNVKALQIKRSGADAQPILEGNPLQLSCTFLTVRPELQDGHHSDITWRLDGHVINLEASQSFSSSQTEQTTLTSANTGMNIGSATVHLYRYRLDIEDFHLRHTGRYSCSLSMLTSDKRFTLEDSLGLHVTEGAVWKAPRLAISPLALTVARNQPITVQCSFAHANVVTFVDRDGNVLKTHTGNKMQGTVKVKVNSSPHTSIQCQGHLSAFPLMVGKSHFMTWKYGDNDDTRRCAEGKDYTGVQWEAAQPGKKVVQLCPFSYTGYAFRQCGKDLQWMPSHFEDCMRNDWILVNEQIKKVTDDGLSASYGFITSLAHIIWTSLSKPLPVLSCDIQRVAAILAHIGSLVAQPKEDVLVDAHALDIFASVVDKIFSSSSDEWKKVLEMEKNDTVAGSGNKIMIAMDQLVLSSLREPIGSSPPIVKNNIAIKRSSLTTKDIIFPDVKEKEYGQFDGWVIASGNTAFLSGKNFDNEDIRYGVILLRNVSSKMSVNPEKQKRHETGQVFHDSMVKSDVIAFTLSRDVNPLSPRLRLTFWIPQENYTDPKCGFLDTSVANGSVWSDDGCETGLVGPGMVECRCSHLTNFAILMSPSGIVDEKYDILSAITYVGCVISILCLLITVGVHVAVWRYVKGDRVKLHVHLSVCLILAYLVFLAGVQRTDNDTACTVVAILLHFLFLAAFFLMLAEGIHIFLSVIVVFHHKPVMARLLTLAYGTPLLIVGLSYLVSSKNAYRSHDFCWLERTSGLLWAFVVPVAAIILVNFVIFVLVVKAMLHDGSVHTNKPQSDARSMIRAVCVLSPILGLTWVFGVLAVNEHLVAFQYLFAFFNSLQGFFIFIFHCAFSSQVRNALKAFKKRQKAGSLEQVPKTSSYHNEDFYRRKCLKEGVGYFRPETPSPVAGRDPRKMFIHVECPKESNLRKHSSSSTTQVLDHDSCSNSVFE